MKLTIHKAEVLDLSSDQRRNLLLQLLVEHTDGRWIDGKNVVEEVYTSHKFDSVVGRVSDPKLAVCVAAIRLRMALLESQS